MFLRGTRGTVIQKQYHNTSHFTSVITPPTLVYLSTVLLLLNFLGVYSSALFFPPPYSEQAEGGTMVLISRWRL